MPVRPDKLLALHHRMILLKIQEKDLLEQFVLGHGKGGQKRQKCRNCVVIRHLPTGLVVRCERERSREINRYLARRQLCDLLEKKSLQKMADPKKEPLLCKDLESDHRLDTE